MRTVLPTYEDCIEICNSKGLDVFYETKHVLEGYNVSIFNYRLAQDKDFISPIDGRTDITAHELRGLTFVFNKDGTVFKRFLMLPKFWNINQTECSMYHNISHLEIDNVYSKEDGSLISFIMLPNGSIYARSKMSFISSQACDSMNILNERPSLKEYITKCINNDIIPIFEYVSFKNRIVLYYKETDLILLRLRNNIDGTFIDIYDNSSVYYSSEINKANKYTYTLDQMVEMAKTQEDIEGWIVQFKNGKMIKIKTEWYFNLHKIFTEDIYMEHTLVSLILEDKIDDVLSFLPEEATQERNKISELIDVLNKEISKIAKIVDEEISLGTNDRKEFAIRNSQKDYFDILISVAYKNADKIDKIRSWIIKKCSHQTKAKEFLNNLGWHRL